MANNKAYTYNIAPIGIAQPPLSAGASVPTLSVPNLSVPSPSSLLSSASVPTSSVPTSSSGEHYAINQTSPSWVLTFVPWNTRVTFSGVSSSSSPSSLASSSPSSLASLASSASSSLASSGMSALSAATSSLTSALGSKTSDVIVVQNDCVQLSVSTTKGTLTPSMSAVLVMTDTNYATAIAPGDFVFVNILNWQSDADNVAANATNSKPINGPADGFKGLFKVQSVRTILTTDPNSGVKRLLFKIDGFAFTEFNNSIYFNQFMLTTGDLTNDLLFISRLGPDYYQKINSKSVTSVQTIIQFLISSFIGTGIKSLSGKIPVVASSPNTHFLMPPIIGQLMGIPSVKSAQDIYALLFGIQSYAPGLTPGTLTDLATGMNPVDSLLPCPGKTLLKAEYWNNQKAWSIINQYTNAPVNELYTCFKISKKYNTVLPTVVFRQIPFSTDAFASTGINSTPFLSIPRWKIHSSLVMEADLGRDEAARFNFVQYFGRGTLGDTGSAAAEEIAHKNYVTDITDINRSGLRPYIISSQFDEKLSDSSGITDPTAGSFQSPSWAKIMADAVMEGHLKMNGTLLCAGIVEPITVGDNCEFNNTVYHIEAVTHTCSVSPNDGKISFRTQLSLSHGVNVDPNQTSLYPQMQNTNAYSERIMDASNYHILPGISESQSPTVRSSGTIDDTSTGGNESIS